MILTIGLLQETLLSRKERSSLFTTQFLLSLFPHIKGKQLPEHLTIREVTTDSRKIATNSLFIPIVGERFDGHTFIKEAVKNGAVAALWQKDKPIPHSVQTLCTFFSVDDTLDALQTLAHAYRQVVDPTIIAITGSNGKTTTKDITQAVLRTTYKTHATKGNFNNDIGMPLTLLQMPRDTEVAVVEMGMNDFGEIRLLTNIAKPDYAIVTNIGESHIEHLGSREGIRDAKLEIVAGLQENGMLIIDGDEPLLTETTVFSRVRTCSFTNGDSVIENVQIDGKTTTFTIDNTTYTIPLLGKHHAKNASFAIFVAKQLQIDEEMIKRGLMNVHHSNMRFEMIEGKNNVTIINDAYNASPTSMRAAIDVVKQLTGFQYKGLVLADVLELGSFAQALHRTISEKIDPTIDFVFTYGTEAKAICDEVKKRYPEIVTEHFESKDELIIALEDMMRNETIILFKGSRGMHLEDVIEQFI